MPNMCRFTERVARIHEHEALLLVALPIGRALVAHGLYLSGQARHGMLVCKYIWDYSALVKNLGIYLFSSQKAKND